MNNRDGKYRVVKVGRFEIGTYTSKLAAKKVIKNLSDYGFYQIIEIKSGYAIWEGYN